jgi:outer membrane protein assembly factor BamB
MRGPIHYFLHGLEKNLTSILRMTKQVYLLKKTSKKLVVHVSIFLIVSFLFSGQFISYSTSSRNDWPLSRHDTSNTGFSNSTAPIPSIVQLWNYTIEESPSSPPASLVVVDGLVYFVSADSNIYCLEGSTGTKVWNFSTGGTTDSCPAVIDSRAYVGSADGYIYCLDASSGTQVWNHSVGVSVDSPVNFVTGRVYVESKTGDVYCLDAISGEKLWNFSTGADADRHSLAISGNHIFATNSNGDVFCLDVVSGVSVWNFTVGDSVSSPVAVDGFVYFGSRNGNAYCLDASDGVKIWNYTTWYNSAGPSHNYHWGNVVSAPAVAYGNVFVGSSDFDVFCLDAMTGLHVWNFSTNGEVYLPPTVADGCVFAGSYDGYVYCLNASSGIEIWRYAAGGFSRINVAGSAGSPVVAEGVVYVVGNGVLFALGSPFSDSTFPSFEVIFVVVFVIIAASIGIYAYSKRRHEGRYQ